MLCRASTRAMWMPVALVSRTLMINGASGRNVGSWPAPDEAVAGKHVVAARGPPGAGRVPLGLGVERAPEVEDRVQDLPGQLDLFVLREQRRGSRQHPPEQPPAGLRAGF